MRQYLRNKILDILSRNVIKEFHHLIDRNSKAVQFLYFHHVKPEEEDKFRDLLKLLSTHFKFISFTDAVSKIQTNQIDDSYLCLSSDDGFKNNLQAAKIANEFCAPICFFINPFFINNAHNNTLHHTKLVESVFKLKDLEFLTWDDIDFIISLGHEIGNHGFSHKNLGAADRKLIYDEITIAHQILVEKNIEVKHFAFPYGRKANYSPVMLEVLLDLGYLSIGNAIRGIHINHECDLKCKLLQVNRDHIIFDWPLKHQLYFIQKNFKCI